MTTHAGGEPRGAPAVAAGHGGGVRRVLRPAGGGEGAPVLGGQAEAQPALLRHHLRDRRPQVLDGLPPPGLLLPRRRQHGRMARQAPEPSVIELNHGC